MWKEKNFFILKLALTSIAIKIIKTVLKSLSPSNLLYKQRILAFPSENYSIFFEFRDKNLFFFLLRFRISNLKGRSHLRKRR